MAEIKRTKGYLALATGRVFQGWCFGASPEQAQAKNRGGGEVVFNTSLSGYQEILTDPSYQGQIVAMTASHIGNYGTNPEDIESRGLFLSGFVVQEMSVIQSNWRATQTLHEYLSNAGVPALSGIDTRALTRYLRSQGAVNGIISSDGRDLKGLIKKARTVPGLEGRNLAEEVSAGKTYEWNDGTVSVSAMNRPDDKKKKHNSKEHIVVMDFGVKQNILRCLVDQGCKVTVVPANASSQEIIDKNPDGILFSNGPGDPSAVEDGIKTIQELIQHNLTNQKKGTKVTPMFGICLGHQLLGLALGGSTYKLKFGHHGANHPIKDLETGRVDITAQNHGFAVEGQKLSNGEWIIKGNKDALVTHINLNDNAIEGLRHKKLPLFSVQYHPEASSGPHDAHHLFDRFLGMVRKNA